MGRHAIKFFGGDYDQTRNGILTNGPLCMDPAQNPSSTCPKRWADNHGSGGHELSVGFAPPAKVGRHGCHQSCGHAIGEQFTTG